MKKKRLTIVLTGVILLSVGMYVNSNHENNIKMSKTHKIETSKTKEKKPIPYVENYTVQGCIKKFHTYNNFEKSIKDSSFLTDETIVILEPDVNPKEAALWAPGPNGITHLNLDGSVKDTGTVTDKDPRAAKIKHIKKALKVVDENTK